jgi:Asp-tRNA(Asn)/Glu-tRNA(Gln) amidotransferase B subunit
MTDLMDGALVYPYTPTQYLYIAVNRSGVELMGIVETPSQAAYITD